jgi:hypothetical protein
MTIIVRWTDWEGAGLELCALREDADALSLEGALVGTRDGLYGAFYTVRTDALFRTREVEVCYAGGARLRVASDGEGRWRDLLHDVSLQDLDGCLDVDIGVTPATNALPIRRLKLAANESRDIVVAYVPLPSQITGAFRPTRADQRYTCVVPGRTYRYEGLFRSFSANLDIDDAGLVLDYPPMFRRVAEARR